MTNEQINIAIAETCGWRHEVLEPVDADKIWLLPSDLPDYCNDLNATHEVEKTLTDIEYKRYCLFLDDLCVDDRGYGYPNWGRSATALQRCESFLKTIGKWKE